MPDGETRAEAGNALINIMGTYDPKVGRGDFAYGRYSNPALDTLTDQALATMDDTAREKLLIQAVEIAMAELPIIPLHMLINFWAARKGVVYEARRMITLAIGAHLAESMCRQAGAPNCINELEIQISSGPCHSSSGCGRMRV